MPAPSKRGLTKDGRPKKKPGRKPMTKAKASAQKPARKTMAKGKKKKAPAGDPLKAAIQSEIRRALQGAIATL